MTDPRPENPVGKTYTVDGLGNVIGGRLTVYNNQPIGNYWDGCPKNIDQIHIKIWELKLRKVPFRQDSALLASNFFLSCVSEFVSRNIDFSLR